MADFVANDTFREIRRKKGSRKQLATLLETSAANIERWERGEIWPEPAMLRRLCALFEMSPQELGFSVGPGQRSVDGRQTQSLRAPALSQQEVSVQQDSYGDRVEANSAPIYPSPVYDSAIPLLPAVPLVGRAWELFQIKQRLKEGRNRAWMVLNGLPGVGKTALVLNIIYDSEIRAHFSDGILYGSILKTGWRERENRISSPNPPDVDNTKGTTLTEQVTASDSFPAVLDSPTVDVLRRWGALLGISEAQWATLNDAPSWTTTLRKAIGNRKMLLVIDDACKFEDVLALGVGGANCAYLVTTRFAHIATRIAPGGTIHLQELPEEESIELLHLLAPRVVNAEPERVRELVRSVGGLPLALTLMGNYLRTQTANKLPRRITATLERLSHSRERLQVYELDPLVEKHPGLPDGALVSLQSVIAVSDQLLSPSSRATLYALAIFPPKPQSFSEELALAVAACTYEDLDNLSDAGILERHGDRYMLHQVIADYARLQLQGQTEQDVIERLLASLSESVGANRKEYDLLEEESSSIRTALNLAHRYAHWGKLVRITCSFMPFLIIRGLYREAEYHLQRAYAAACGSGQGALLVENLDDPDACIQLLSYLGEVAQKRGELALAETHLQRGLEGARSVQHSDYICDLLKNLGWIASKRGDYMRAHVYLQEGLQLARQRKDDECLCGILSILGSVLATKGEYGQANSYLSEGLALARQIEDRQQICSLLINRGTMYGSLGDFLHAEEAFHEGLFHARQLGHLEWISLLLLNLGDIAREHDDYQLAEQYFHEVLELVREMGHRELLCISLMQLAISARQQGNYVQAHAYLEESLALSQQVEQPQVAACVLYEYAELHFDLQLIPEAKELFLTAGRMIPPGNQELFALAYYGLARTLAAQGNLAEAREIGTESAEVFESMRHRKAEEVRLWLEELL